MIGCPFFGQPISVFEKTKFIFHIISEFSYYFRFFISIIVVSDMFLLFYFFVNPSTRSSVICRMKSSTSICSGFIDVTFPLICFAIALEVLGLNSC